MSETSPNSLKAGRGPHHIVKIESLAGPKQQVTSQKTYLKPHAGSNAALSWQVLLVVLILTLDASAVLLLTRNRISSARQGLYTALFVLTGIILLLVKLVADIFFPGSSLDAVTIVAAISALVTLILVQRQGEIARRELQVVAEDLEFSRKQAEFNQTQLQVQSQRPDLQAYFANGQDNFQLDETRGTLMFSPNFLIYNSGERTARDALLEILAPWKIFAERPSEEAALRRADTRRHGEVLWRRFTTAIDQPIYRGIGNLANGFVEALAQNMESFDILWRIYDDFGSYPKDRDFGTLHVEYAPATGKGAKLTFEPRWSVDRFPMLGWDRTSPGGFVYAAVIPGAAPTVPILDQDMETTIVDIVHGMPGLAQTTTRTTEDGIEFLAGVERPPSEFADFEEYNRYNRDRHRCYVRRDGMVEVRIPEDESHALYQVLRSFGDAYAIAALINKELGALPNGSGHIAWKLERAYARNVIIDNTEYWFDIDLTRRDFTSNIAPVIMKAQRAGGVPPDRNETTRLIEQYWQKNYAEKFE